MAVPGMQSNGVSWCIQWEGWGAGRVERGDQINLPSGRGESETPTTLGRSPSPRPLFRTPELSVLRKGEVEPKSNEGARGWPGAN